MYAKSLTHSLELLEDRIAPANFVVVTQPTPGEIVLTGDDAENNLQIFEPEPGKIRIEAGGPTLLNPGGVSSMDFTAPTKLTFICNDGGDTLQIFQIHSLTALTMQGGPGPDQLSLEEVNVAGTVTFAGGGGDNDVFSVNGLQSIIAGDLNLSTTGGSLLAVLAAEQVKIGGNLILTGGAGDETLDNGGTLALTIGKGLMLDGGSGGLLVVDLAVVGGLKIGKLSTGESLLVSGGAQTSLSLSGGAMTLGGGVKFKGTLGDDTLSLNARSGSLKIGTLKTGQSVFMEGGLGAETLSLRGADLGLTGGVEYDDILGSSEVTIESYLGATSIGKLTSGQSIKFDTASGADRLTFSGPTVRLTGGIEFLAGGGSNVLSFDEPSGAVSIGKLLKGESIKFTGGTGADTILFGTLAMTLAGGIDFTGGDGNNSITASETTTLTIGKLTVGEASLKYTGGLGPDSVTLRGTKIGLAGGVDFAGGAGDNFVNLLAGSGGLSLGKLTPGQSINYSGLDDDDAILLSGVSVRTTGSIEALLGNGTNSLRLGSNFGVITIGKNQAGQSITYTGGTEDDTLASDASRLTLQGSVRFDGAGGTNKLDLHVWESMNIGTFITGQSIPYLGGDGTDLLSLTGGAVTLKGSAIMVAAGGANHLSLQNAATVFGKDSAGDSLKMTGGAGDDFMELGTSITATGSFTFDLSDGSNMLFNGEARRLRVDGSLTFLGGEGTDHFSISGSALTIGKGIHFEGKGGPDTVSILGEGAISGDSVINLGPNTDPNEEQSAELGSFVGKKFGLAVRGALAITSAAATDTADSVNLYSLTVAKKLSVFLGDGNGRVFLNNLNALDTLDLATGSGNDDVKIEDANYYGGNSIIAKLATILLGAGTDKLTIGSALPLPEGGATDSTRVRFTVGLMADGGPGLDTVNAIATENDFPSHGLTLTGFEL